MIASQLQYITQRFPLGNLDRAPSMNATTGGRPLLGTTTRRASNISINASGLVNDRLKDVKAFDETKLGVKGLVNSGITQIPSIFHHPSENLVNSEPGPVADPIPIIDLSGPTPEVVGRIRDAANKFGFFQVVNHGVPISVLDGLVNGVKGFHELADEERMRYYSRDMVSGVNYMSNVDLYVSKAASWRDTLQLRLGPTPPDFDAIPPVCRYIISFLYYFSFYISTFFKFSSIQFSYF